MADALESFQLSDTPIAPRPEFARALRARLEGSETMTQTTTMTLTPYIAVHDADAAIGFYVRAFGAVELYRLTGRDGRVGHAEIRIGGNGVMLADEFPEAGAVSPRTLGGSPVLLHLQVPDADSFVARAVENGAVLVRPIEDHFYGARGGTLSDPFGYLWMVQTPVEDVTDEEIQRRFAAMEDQQ